MKPNHRAADFGTDRGRRADEFRVRAGHVEARGRPARLVGHLDLRRRPARRHLQEAWPHARAALHPGRRRDPAGGDLRQRRDRRRGRHHGRAERLFEERAGAHHRRRDHRRRRPVLVREGGLADQDHPGLQRQDHRLFDQRLLDPRRRHRLHQAIRAHRRQGHADRRAARDHDRGDVRAGRRRLVGAAGRPRSARQERDPPDRHRQRHPVQGPDRAAPDHQHGRPCRTARTPSSAT